MNNGNAVIQRLWRQCQRRAKAIPDSETMSRNSWRKIAKDGLRLLGGGKQFDKPGRETGRASVCSRLRHEWLLGTSSPPLNFRIARCVRLTADTPSAVTRKKRLDRPPRVLALGLQCGIARSLLLPDDRAWHRQRRSTLPVSYALQSLAGQSRRRLGH